MKRTIRPILIVGNTAFITLTKGFIATIDAADVALVEGFSWLAMVHRHTVYAVRNSAVIDGKRKMIYLHRQIMAPPDGVQVDHISGEGLDCRRANMRLATNAQNQQNQRLSRGNKSGYKGVFCYVPGQKWVAKIRVGGNQKHLGYFTTPEAAYAAYIEAAERLFGEFARAG